MVKLDLFIAIVCYLIVLIIFCFLCDSSFAVWFHVDCSHLEIWFLSLHGFDYCHLEWWWVSDKLWISSILLVSLIAPQKQNNPILMGVHCCFVTGTIMTISKDRVKPSPLPDSWKLKEIFATGIVLGGYLALMTVIFFWLMDGTNFFSVCSLLTSLYFSESVEK